jgi:hypothetical protein
MGKTTMIKAEYLENAVRPRIRDRLERRQRMTSCKH